MVGCFDQKKAGETREGEIKVYTHLASTRKQLLGRLGGQEMTF